MTTHPNISPALLEANRRLYQMRVSVCPVANTPAKLLVAVEPVGDAEQAIERLPAHLGWGSGALTAVLRRKLKSEEREVRSEERPLETQNPKLETQNSELETTKLYPDLALGMIEQGQVLAGRVWLLLRYLDKTGCGWSCLDSTREQLTTPTSPYYLCGTRQLRKLLAAGRGVFWQQDKKRLWLRSAAHVANALGVDRLSGQPVALPVSILLRGVGEVKAHFYASFHSGRKSHTPISRQTLSKLTHIPRRTQRQYEKTTGLQAQRNIAVGERHTAENVQKRAWLHGTAVFDFIDHHGLQGPEKRRYVAWHLPNSYQGCHVPCAKGRQKKINRQLGLVNHKARGNKVRGNRLFYPNGAVAGQMYNRDSSQDRYWQQGTAAGKRPFLWQVLSATEC